MPNCFIFKCIQSLTLLHTTTPNRENKTTVQTDIHTQAHTTHTYMYTYRNTIYITTNNWQVTNNHNGVISPYYSIHTKKSSLLTYITNCECDMHNVTMGEVTYITTLCTCKINVQYLIIWNHISVIVEITSKIMCVDMTQN